MNNQFSNKFFGGKHPQQKSFDYAKESGNKFFIAKDVIYNDNGKNRVIKNYASFKDINEWFEFESKLETENKFYYEQMIDERIEMYDIDGDNNNQIFRTEEDGLSRPVTDEEFIDEFIDARLDFNDTHYSHIPLSRNNFIIKKTDDPKGIKRSFHILIRNGMKFKSTDDNKRFAKEFASYCKDTYKVKIDSSIYSQNRVIRCLGHHKRGQPNRFSYRLKDFSLFNETCNRKLFYCTYLEGHEKPYEFKTIETIKTKEEQEDDEANEMFKTAYKVNIKNDTNRYTINNLVKLILETINNKSSPICDEEFPDKLNYCNWYKLVLTVFNCIDRVGCMAQDPDTLRIPLENLPRDLYDEMFKYYRHNKEINADEYYKNLSEKTGFYKDLTISSLHYLARFNEKYKTLFASEIKEYNQFIKNKRFEKRLSRSLQLNTAVDNANKSQTDIVEAYTPPIKYIHEIHKLVSISNKKVYTKKYIEYIVNSIVCKLINGGKESMFCKDSYYCRNSQTTLENYSQVKYDSIISGGGALRIQVQVINEKYLDELKEYNKLNEKERKKLKMEEPSDFYEIMLADGAKPSIVENMNKLSRLKILNKPVFVPYLYKDEEMLKNYKDCLNLFMGFPHKVSSEINTDLYKNSKLRENLRKYLCNGDTEPKNFEYIEKHTAHMIQKPSELSLVCILMVGAQGTGKDLWMSLLSKIIGLEYYLDIGNMDSFFKNFNTNQKCKLLTKLNEISDKGSTKEKHDQLKHKITQPQIEIEPKGIDSFFVDHHSRYYGFSQNENIVIVEHTDRRFFMIKTNNDMANNLPYFAEIVKELGDIEMIKSCFNYYATLHIEGFVPMNFPSTQYKDEQKIQCLPNSFKFIYYIFFETEETEFSKSKDEIFSDYLSWCMKSNIKARNTQQNFIKDLHTFGLTDKVKKINGKSIRCINSTRQETEELFKKYLKNPSFKF